MFKITDLTKLDISFKEYTDNCLSGVFKPLAIQANNELKEEDAFNRLAVKVVILIDAVVNDKIFKYLQDDYDKFKEVVGQRRAELTKSAIYNEIQFRSNSNYDSSLDKQIQTLYTNLSTLGKDDNSVNTPYQTLAPTTIEILRDACWGDIDNLGVGASEPLSDIVKELDNKANKDALNNVEFDASNNGKIVKVDNCKVGYLDPNDLIVDTSELENGIKENKTNILDLKTKTEENQTNILDLKTKTENITSEVDSVKENYALKDGSNVLTDKSFNGYFPVYNVGQPIQWSNLPITTNKIARDIVDTLKNVYWYDKTAVNGYCILTTGNNYKGVTFEPRMKIDFSNALVNKSYAGRYVAIDNNGKVTFTSITTSGGADKMDNNLGNMSVDTKYAGYGVAVASDGKVDFKEFAEKSRVDDIVTKLDTVTKEVENIINAVPKPYELGTDFKQSVNKPNWKFISCSDLYACNSYAGFFAILQDLATDHGVTYTEDEYREFLRNVGGSQAGVSDNSLWTNANLVCLRLITESNITVDNNELVAHAGEVLLFSTYGEASAFYTQHGSKYCQFINDNLYLRTGDNGGIYGSDYIAQSDLPNVSYDTSHTHDLLVEQRWNGTSVLAGGDTTGNASWISGYCHKNGPTIHLNGNVTQTEFTPRYRQVSAILCLQDIYRDITNSAKVDNPLNWFVNWKA